MKISYFFNTIEKGGAEYLVLNVATEILRNNPSILITVVIFNRADNDLLHTFQHNNITVLNLNLPPKTPKIKKIYSVYQFLKTYKPDIVHSHCESTDFIAMFCSFLAGIKLRFCTIHNMDQQKTWRSRTVYFLKSLFSTKIIAVTQRAKDYYINEKFFDPKKLVVIYNCPGFNPGIVKPRVFPHSNYWNLINVGGLRIQKGQIYLIQAMKYLESKGIPAKLTIYGADRFNYGEILYREVKNLNISNVLFKPHCDSIVDEYNNADIFVTSSIREAMPLVVIEALSTGIPIIATDIPAHCEILESVPESFLVNTHDPEALANAIESLIKNKTRYESLSSSQLVKSSDFTLEKTVYQHLQLYKSSH